MKFPLDPVSFRVAADRACGLFLSVDFVRDWVYYDLGDSKRSDLLVVRRL